MSRAFPSDQKKWDMNSVPQLDVTWANCQVWVYSDNFQVSLDERKEQEFGQRLARAGVTDWIQQQRDEHLSLA